MEVEGDCAFSAGGIFHGRSTPAPCVGKRVFLLILTPSHGVNNVLRVEATGAILEFADAGVRVLVIPALYHKHDLKSSCERILGKIESFEQPAEISFVDVGSLGALGVFLEEVEEFHGHIYL